jgi:hypothetical protein
MLDLPEIEKSIIRLTGREREELQECECAVTSGLSEFLRVGKALSTIRNKRLFRETHPTFEAYIKERWGLGIGGTESLITSYHIAEQLEEAGINLPAQVTQSAMRSLSKVSPTEGLRAAVWRFASSISPGAECPPIALLQRITRIIREALYEKEIAADGSGNPIDEGSEEDAPAQSAETETRGRPLGNGSRKNTKKGANDERFLRALIRMSSYRGFSVPLIVSQIGSEKMASYTWTTCERLKERLDAIEAAILKAYPHAQTPRA